jgi:hypothetical protein
MDLMGWRGAGGNGAAGIGTYYFFGGLLMILGSLGEVSTISVANPNRAMGSGVDLSDVS